MTISNTNQPSYVKMLTTWGGDFPAGVLSWAANANTAVIIKYTYDITTNDIPNASEHEFSGNNEADVGSMKWATRQAMNELEKVANIQFIPDDNAASKIVFSDMHNDTAKGAANFGNNNQHVTNGLISGANVMVEGALFADYAKGKEGFWGGVT